MFARHPSRVLGLPRQLAVIYSIVFAAAFLIYPAAWPAAPLVAPDTQGYVEFARDLRDGAVDELHARAPGLPILLLLTNPTGEPRRSLLYVLLALHCIAVWMLARLLHGSNVPALFTAFFGVLAMTPLFTQTAGWALSEGLAQFLLVSGVFTLAAADRRGNRALIAVSGLAFACAGITRPAFQLLFLPIVFLIWAYYRRKPHHYPHMGRHRVKVFALAFLAPVLAYCSFNLTHFGYFGITYWLGHNLSTRTARIVHLLPEEYAGPRAVLVPARDAQWLRDPSPGSLSVHWYANHALPDLQRETGLNGIALADYMLGINLRLIRDHPLSYGREVAESFAGYWFPFLTSLSRGPRASLMVQSLLHFLIVGAFFAQAAILTGMFAGGVRMDHAARPPVRLGLPYLGAAAIIIYTAVVSCMVDTGEARQRAPTDLLILFSVFLGGYWRFAAGQHMGRNARLKRVVPSESSLAAQPVRKHAGVAGKAF